MTLFYRSLQYRNTRCNLRQNATFFFAYAQTFFLFTSTTLAMDNPLLTSKNWKDRVTFYQTFDWQLEDHIPILKTIAGESIIPALTDSIKSILVCPTVDFESTKPMLKNVHNLKLKHLFLLHFERCIYKELFGITKNIETHNKRLEIITSENRIATASEPIDHNNSSDIPLVNIPAGILCADENFYDIFVILNEDYSVKNAKKRYSKIKECEILAFVCESIKTQKLPKNLLFYCELLYRITKFLGPIYDLNILSHLLQHADPLIRKEGIGLCVLVFEIIDAKLYEYLVSVKDIQIKEIKERIGSNKDSHSKTENQMSYMHTNKVSGPVENAFVAPVCSNMERNVVIENPISGQETNLSLMCDKVKRSAGSKQMFNTTRDRYEHTELNDVREPRSYVTASNAPTVRTESRNAHIGLEVNTVPASFDTQCNNSNPTISNMNNAITNDANNPLESNNLNRVNTNRFLATKNISPTFLSTDLYKAIKDKSQYYKTREPSIDLPDNILKALSSPNYKERLIAFQNVLKFPYRLCCETIKQITLKINDPNLQVSILAIECVLLTRVGKDLIRMLIERLKEKKLKDNILSVLYEQEVKCSEITVYLQNQKNPQIKISILEYFSASEEEFEECVIEDILSMTKDGNKDVRTKAFELCKRIIGTQYEYKLDKKVMDLISSNKNESGPGKIETYVKDQNRICVQDAKAFEQRTNSSKEQQSLFKKQSHSVKETGHKAYNPKTSSANLFLHEIPAPKDSVRNPPTSLSATHALNPLKHDLQQAHNPNPAKHDLQQAHAPNIPLSLATAQGFHANPHKRKRCDKIIKNKIKNRIKNCKNKEIIFEGFFVELLNKNENSQQILDLFDFSDKIYLSDFIIEYLFNMKEKNKEYLEYLNDLIDFYIENEHVLNKLEIEMIYEIVKNKKEILKKLKYVYPESKLKKIFNENVDELNSSLLMFNINCDSPCKKIKSKDLERNLFKSVKFNNEIIKNTTNKQSFLEPNNNYTNEYMPDKIINSGSLTKASIKPNITGDSLLRPKNGINRQYSGIGINKDTEQDSPIKQGYNKYTMPIFNPRDNKDHNKASTKQNMEPSLFAKSNDCTGFDFSNNKEYEPLYNVTYKRSDEGPHSAAGLSEGRNSAAGLSKAYSTDHSLVAPIKKEYRNDPESEYKSLFLDLIHSDQNVCYKSFTKLDSIIEKNVNLLYLQSNGLISSILIQINDTFEMKNENIKIIFKCFSKLIKNTNFLKELSKLSIKNIILECTRLVIQIDDIKKEASSKNTPSHTQNHTQNHAQNHAQLQPQLQSDLQSQPHAQSHAHSNTPRSQNNLDVNHSLWFLNDFVHCSASQILLDTLYNPNFDLVLNILLDLLIFYNSKNCCLEKDILSKLIWRHSKICKVHLKNKILVQKIISVIEKFYEKNCAKVVKSDLKMCKVIQLHLLEIYNEYKNNINEFEFGSFVKRIVDKIGNRK